LWSCPAFDVLTQRKIEFAPTRDQPKVKLPGNSPWQNSIKQETKPTKPNQLKGK
jgi:hypothetical protein